MSCRRCTSLVFALMASAWGASANTLLGQQFGTPAVATRGTADLIVRTELEQAAGQTAWQVVQNLRPRWLQPLRASAFAGVVVNASSRGEIEELRSLLADDIEIMRRLSPTEATTRYGTGYSGGLIEVTTRGRVTSTGRLAAGASPAAAVVRPPVPGDLLRVECFSPQAQEGQIAEGFFEGAGDGALLLSVGSQSQSVAVPVVNVTRVEVRSTRSRSRVGGLIGVLVGAAAGVVIGESWSQGRQSSLHWPREWYIGVGGVVGAFSGLLAGNIIGSRIKTDVWLEAPENWVVRYVESGSTTPSGSARAMGCLSPT